MNHTAEPIPVHVVNHPKPGRFEYRGAYRTAVLTAANPYQQIAGPDPLRKWIETGPASAGPAAAAVPLKTQNITGSITSPTAGQTIAQIPLGVGTFTIQWTVELSGTVGAPELNNFQLVQTGTGAPGAVLTSINAAAAGTYTQLSVTIVSTNADNFIKINAVALGTVGAVYNAQMTATQDANAASPTSNAYVVCGSISQASDGNNAANPITQPNGRLVPAGSLPIRIDGQQEVWLVASVFPTIVGYTIVREVPENG